MVKRLSKKEKGFIKDFVETGNGTQSALNHYDIKGKDKEKIASTIAVENLGKLRIQNEIKSIADRIPEKDLLKVHKEGLNAIDTIVNMKNGEVIAEVPDYSTRHKYLDTAYKLKGVYAPEKSLTINANLPLDEEKLKAFNEWHTLQTKQHSKK